MQSPPGDEKQLVAAARGGDVRSYEELVRSYQGLAFRVAFLVVRSTDAAEDAIQEAFVKAYRALDRFDTARPFRPWLLRIVANEARNARKATWRRGTLANRYGEALNLRNPADSPDELAVRNERRNKLLSAIDLLDDGDRLVLSLRYFTELSEREMADVMKCRQGTVKSRLSRSMERLRKLIAERFPELEPAHGE